MPESKPASSKRTIQLILIFACLAVSVAQTIQVITMDGPLDALAELEDAEAYVFSKLEILLMGWVPTLIQLAGFLYVALRRDSWGEFLVVLIMVNYFFIDWTTLYTASVSLRPWPSGFEIFKSAEGAMAIRFGIPAGAILVLMIPLYKLFYNKYGKVK